MAHTYTQCIQRNTLRSKKDIRLDAFFRLADIQLGADKIYDPRIHGYSAWKSSTFLFLP